MSFTVLGKRTRSSVETGKHGPQLLRYKVHTTNVASTEAVRTTVTRAKRRALVTTSNDENRNPFVTRRNEENGENEHGTDVDELALPTKRTRVSARTVPAKHGALEQRITVSPSKIDTYFKAAKPAIEVYQDSKSTQVPTPKTPRHRDALSKKVPVTPRHRTLIAGAQFSPRTPKTPGTPSTSVYTRARQIFSRCSNSGKLVGRDNERRELSTFIQERMDNNGGGCLYVSGPPGTGKSAFVDEVCQGYKNMEHVRTSTVNCMSVKNAKDLAGKLSEDLGLDEKVGLEYLRSCFVDKQGKKHFSYLVILDEVDRLVDMDLALLYSLFEWSMQPLSRLVLIGIANALDLTDRFLPRLKARSLKPDLLPFMPYSSIQIAEVITTKLRSLCAPGQDVIPFLHPTAIQFCAKKVAAQTGDLRKAFDICRRAIDLVEQETRDQQAKLALQESPTKTPLMENINLSSPPTPCSPRKSLTKTKMMPSATAFTLETAPKATIAHIAKVTSAAFGNGTTQRLATLNLQQKAVLCSLSALEKRKRDSPSQSIFATPSKKHESAPTVKQLYEAYTQICRKEQLLHPLTNIEFRDVVSGLETLSLLSAVDGNKGGSFALPLTPSKTPSRRGRGGFGSVVVGDEKKVASAVGQRELLAALVGAGSELLKEILEGDGLLL